MDSKYYFSIIIPCHNSGKTIDRLMNSIVHQDYPKDDFEVILCDDGHEDNWIKKIDKYKNRLNIVYCETKPREIHCPGNTRHDALPLAQGEWILFADHDDILTIDALRIGRRLIEEHNEKFILATKPTIFDTKDTEEGLCSYGFNVTLLHGKFYNRAFLKKHNINFLENLETHEDLYFNTAVICALYKEGQMQMPCYDNPIYVWVIHDESTTQSFYKDCGNGLKKNYLEEHFADYLFAYTANYLKLYAENSKWHEKIQTHLMYSILYGYYYYQGELFHLGAEISKSELESLKNHIYKIMSACNISGEDIINYIYSDPIMFDVIRKEIPQTEGPFIETQSFKDFIKTNIK